MPMSAMRSRVQRFVAKTKKADLHGKRPLDTTLRAGIGFEF